MTLCIAAKCLLTLGDVESSRIVVCADSRVEMGVASSDWGFKYEGLANGLWAMFSGNNSKAHEFTSTIRQVLKETDVPLSSDELFRVLNEASAKHKARLCEQKAQREFGISYERLLSHGEHELPEANRLRFFHDLEHLSFGCQILIVTFIDNKAEIFCIEDNGEVEHESSFAAIGSGSPVAEANLCFRRQSIVHPLSFTLYNVYESARLAYEAVAPGVGEVYMFMILEPRPDGRFDGYRLSSEGFAFLDKLWNKHGPKKMMKLWNLEPKHLEGFTQPEFQEEP